MKQDSQQTIDDPLNTHTECKTEEEDWRQIEGGHMLNLYHIPHYGKDIFIITYGKDKFPMRNVPLCQNSLGLGTLWMMIASLQERLVYNI